MRTVTLTVALTVLALSVEAAPKREPATPGSREDKAVILNWIRSNLADPYSIRSPGISETTLVPDDAGRRIPVICIEFNARNQAGGYAGIIRTGFQVTPNGLVEAGYTRITTSSCYDPAVVMRPFPELGQIR